MPRLPRIGNAYRRRLSRLEVLVTTVARSCVPVSARSKRAYDFVTLVAMLRPSARCRSRG